MRQINEVYFAMLWILLQVGVALAALRFALALLTRRRHRQTCATMVVLGSGGHTAEMLRLFKNFDASVYRPRVYVAAATDALSGVKATAFEKAWAGIPGKGSDPSGPAYQQAVIPRSREVGQSWTSSALSTAHAMLCALALVFRARPDLVRGFCRGQNDCLAVDAFETTRVHASRRASRGAACPALHGRPPRPASHPACKVLVNGPGTCIPVCLSALLAR